MTNRNQPDQNVATTASDKSGSRLLQIDGLRALAALSVVFFHYTTQFERNFKHSEKLAFDFSLGFLGVNFFFVISGFVIYMTLDKIQAPRDFVVSRFSRLFPPYWVAILLTWVIVSSVGLPGYSVSWKEAVVNLTMLQSFFSIRDVDGVYWSLQVELVFYVWMLILWVTKLFRFSMEVFIGWVLIALAGTLLQSGFGVATSYSIKYFLLLTWIPWFAIGIAIYVILQERSFKPKTIALVLLAFLAIAAKNDMPATILAIVAFFAVYGASQGAILWLAWKPLVFFGAISYPLYLVHEKLGWLIILQTEMRSVSPWVAIFLAVAFSVCLATLIHRLIEMPVSSKMRKFYKQSRFAVSARKFNRLVWAAGGLATIFFFALALIISARLERAAVSPLATPATTGSVPK